MKIWINLQALEIEADIQKSATLPWHEFKSSTQFSILFSLNVILHLKVIPVNTLLRVNKDVL